MSDTLRFMCNNLIPESPTVSSQNLTYPFSNTQDDDRSTYWKTTGQFVIDATNNKLYINDGSDKTATIASATYTIPADLAAAVVTALNSASSGWNCIYDTGLNIFEITRGGTAVIRLTVTTAAAWDALGYTGTADRSTSPFYADEMRAHTSESVICDLGVVTEVKCLAMIAPIDEAFGLSASAVVRLQGNNSNSWTSPTYNELATVTERGCFLHVPNATFSSYRYWRIYITDRLNAAGAGIKIASVIYLGGATVIGSSGVAKGFSRSTIDPSISMVSASGRKYFDSRQKYDVFTSLSVQNVTEADRILIDNVFAEVGVTTPFFMSIDAFQAASNSIDELTRYVRFSKPPPQQNSFYKYYNIGLEFEEAI
jgi:hypothetical protein